MGIGMVQPGGPWLTAAAGLDDGRALADACARAGLRQENVSRLVSPGAGAWVDLLETVEGARVLLAEHSPGLASKRMAREAAVVGFVDTDDACAHFRRRWLRDEPAEVVVDTERRLTTDRGPWDVVILDGVLPSRPGRLATVAARLRTLARSLAPDGRVVVVGDNWLSPMRAADRAVGRAGGSPGPAPLSLERAFQTAGLNVVQRFALLRSSVDGVTAFDLDAPHSASAVLAAAVVNMGHARATGLRALRMLAQRRSVAKIVPAWMVVAAFPSSPWESFPSRPTGRLGHKRSEETKLLRGEPPTVLDKRYSTPAAAAREAMALREIEARGLGLAPRLLAQPGPDRLHQTWHRGRPLRPAGLRHHELRAWVWRAAETIATIQRATHRRDGTVLVHGDYWLGNLLVDAEEVVAVLDWTRAHWGERTEDVHHLVDHLREMGWARARDISILREVALAAHASV